MGRLVIPDDPAPLRTLNSVHRHGTIMSTFNPVRTGYTPVPRRITVRIDGRADIRGKGRLRPASHPALMLLFGPFSFIFDVIPPQLSATTPIRGMSTPLMKQYARMKAKYPDTLLLFRLGDFYETFEDDAGSLRASSDHPHQTGNGRRHPLAGFLPFPRHLYAETPARGLRSPSASRRRIRNWRRASSNGT